MTKDKLIALNKLSLGQSGKVHSLSAIGQQRRRMLDLGLVSGTVVKALQISPSGDPTAYMIRGAVIALRSEEALKIMILALEG